MNFGRDTDHEFPAVASGGNGLERLFTVFPHILDHARHYLTYTLQGCFRGKDQLA
jgi:hypothetical protein